MTMWNEADEWDCRVVKFGASYLHRYDRYTLPIDNPKSVNHDVYQRAVNRCVGTFLFVLTLLYVALTGNWGAAVVVALWMVTGTLLVLLLLWLVAVGVPELWDWLMGE